MPRREIWNRGGRFGAAPLSNPPNETESDRIYELLQVPKSNVSPSDKYFAY
jgi:hypothetical protein